MLLRQVILVACLFLVFLPLYAQRSISILVLDEFDNPLEDVAVYLRIDSVATTVFIGFTDDKGRFSRKVPSNSSVLFSYLGYEDFVLYDASQSSVVLKKQSEMIQTFTVTAKKKEEPFELITYALNKGAEIYGQEPKYYRIELKDVIKGNDADPLLYNPEGYYEELPYSPPKKVGYFNKDMWSLNWDIYAQEEYDTTVYSRKYFNLVIYGYAGVFDGNPFSVKSSLNSKKLSKNFSARIERTESNELLCYLESESGEVKYLLKFSADSVLIESDFYRTDSFQLNIPGKQGADFGLSPMHVKRTWAYKDGSYHMEQFLFSGYYFINEKNGSKHEFAISEQVNFILLDAVPDEAMIKIPMGILPKE